jgi:hypothetical protein
VRGLEFAISGTGAVLVVANFFFGLARADRRARSPWKVSVRFHPLATSSSFCSGAGKILAVFCSALDSTGRQERDLKTGAYFQRKTEHSTSLN